MLESVKKTYCRKFVFASLLTILAGAAVTVLVLYVSISRDPGASYAESYRRLAALHEEIFFQSVASYLLTTMVIAVGIAAISLLYSFRVAGPVYKLGLIARKFAGGDFSGTVRLRRHDVIHAMADDLNDLAAGYIDLLRRMETSTRESKEIVAAIGASNGGADRDSLERLTRNREEIRSILSNIKL